MLMKLTPDDAFGSGKLRREDKLSPPARRNRSRKFEALVHDRHDLAHAQEGRLVALRHLLGVAGHHDETNAAFLTHTWKPRVCVNILFIKFFRRLCLVFSSNLLYNTFITLEKTHTQYFLIVLAAVDIQNLD